MEGSDLPASQPGSLIAKRRSKKTNAMIILAAVIVVVVIIAASVLIFSPSRSSGNLPYGLHGGDHFIYDATGTYRNTSITGIYNETLVGNQSRSITSGYGYLNSNVRGLNELINNNSYSSGLDMIQPLAVYDVGMGSVNTTFGTKDVTLVFQVHNGWTVVYYRGYDPYVIYGCVANGPDFHLRLILNQTNNDYVKDNDTSSVELPSHQAAVSDSYRFPTIHGVVLGPALYLPNGANFSYNITGNGTNLYTFSEANILSMANGSQYTYYSPMTRLNITNSKDNLVLPPGYYVITVFAGNGLGQFDYDLKVF